jgi:hypothetical protein
MPKVMFKTSEGIKTKHFAYTKQGVEDAKAFAKSTSGKIAIKAYGKKK